MCSCGGVQEIQDFRRKLELQFGPARLWTSDSEPMKKFRLFRDSKKGCIGGSKAYASERTN